ncbi:DUF6111 family protein [Roseibium aestuarii]|uniref:DUF6111 family protein n=1 Tax=Roseibium aestuarii TaxID=2600299 RepID=A0ABW4JWJ7_9HYPH|nr:DUF6111 family protein [Roseibium aestuarii]
MLRVILTHLVLFLLPFLGYGLWLWVTRKASADRAWRDGPMLYLSLAGALLVVLSLVFFASFEKGQVDRDYQPSRMENGRFVPGGFR